MARAFYRAFMGASGLAPAKPGPSIAGASRAAGSAVVKLAVTQGAGGTALVAVGTPANQFTVYPAGTLTGALAVSGLSIASATEIDLMLATVPADNQALDVWYRLADSDTAAVTGSGIYDNATDADGLVTGRQLQLASSALTAAAPTTATPPPGNSVTFQGPAGAPTGANAISALGSYSTAGIVQDGVGGLLVPGGSGGSEAYAVFKGPGVVPDGVMDTSFETGVPPDYSTALFQLFRIDPVTGDCYRLNWFGQYMRLDKMVGGGVTNLAEFANLTLPGTITSLGVRISGSTFTARVNKTDISCIWTDTGLSAKGYFGVGSVGVKPGPTVTSITVSYQ